MGDKIELLESWEFRLHKMQIGHFDAATVAELLRWLIGITAISLSALSAAKFEVNWLNIPIVLTIATSFQQFFGLEKKAAAHRVAGKAYAKARFEAQRLLSETSQIKDEEFKKKLNSIEKDWGDAGKGAPTIPLFILLLLEHFDGDQHTITMITMPFFRRLKEIRPFRDRKVVIEKVSRSYFKLITKTNAQGKRYLCATIPQNYIFPQCEQLIKILGAEHGAFFENKRARDGDENHLTVLSPKEWDDKSVEIYQRYEGMYIDISKLGIGRAISWRDESLCDAVGDDNSAAYFIVCKSAAADKIRKDLSMEKTDFHITLGFNPHDVHGAPKGRMTILPGFELASEMDSALEVH